MQMGKKLPYTNFTLIVSLNIVLHRKRHILSPRDNLSLEGQVITVCHHKPQKRIWDLLFLHLCLGLTSVQPSLCCIISARRKS